MTGGSPEGEPTLTVIVPVYNEHDLARESLARVDDFLGQHFSEYEIIVIESGSRDGTARACDDAAAARPAIEVIHERNRRGFGAAVRLGISRASKRFVTLVTVDLVYPLEVILESLPLLRDYDAVISRRCSDPRPWRRRFQSFVYNSLIRSTCGLGHVTHVNSAFKIYRREVIQSLDLRSAGWFLDVEILALLRRGGHRVTEIAVPFVERTAGRSTITWRTPIAMLGELVQFRRRLAKEEPRAP